MSIQTISPNELNDIIRSRTNRHVRYGHADCQNAMEPSSFGITTESCPNFNASQTLWRPKPKPTTDSSKRDTAALIRALGLRR